MIEENEVVILTESTFNTVKLLALKQSIVSVINKGDKYVHYKQMLS